MIDKNKKYRTRDGKEVRIYETEGTSGGLVHGAIKIDEVWCMTIWTAGGRYSTTEYKYDLVEVKPRIQTSFWINLYPSAPFAMVAWSSHTDAANGRQPGCIATVQVHIDCEEGEGLS